LKLHHSLVYTLYIHCNRSYTVLRAYSEICTLWWLYSFS